MKETKETNTKRNVKINGYKSNVLWAKRDRKREEAEERNAKWAALTPEKQLKALKKRRGESKAQVAKITAKLTK